MKVGIIVARFQTSFLHEGHCSLINYVQKQNDTVIVFLGISSTKLSIQNPLPFEAREAMVKASYPNVKIYSIGDAKYDSEWDKELDKLIESYTDSKDEITLYSDRDGFSKGYKGKYKTEFAYVTVAGISGTKIRMGCHSYVGTTKEWRKGVIWASANKYPVSYQAVDIAVIKASEVLLGKKKGENKLRFIGGFVDPTDNSLEEAAKRELFEECGHIEIGKLEYLGSYRIDDWRYKKEKDKILSAFFACTYLFGNIKPSDDIEEAKWVPIYSLKDTDIEPEHLPLFKALSNYMFQK